jgi:hypothetical protein
VLTAATGAVLLSLRWFEAKVGTGGFFSGVVIGVVLSFGALLAFIASTRRKVETIRAERIRVKLPEATARRRDSHLSLEGTQPRRNGGSHG